ncbi:MAG TPA: cupin domain-containing protein [Terracidiphilus sp.]|nr:cupin domain-containing protein [Terracidiphilus sp.]
MRQIPTSLLALFCAAAVFPPVIAAAQQTNSGNAPANPLAASRVFAYDDMAPRTAPNGSISRKVFTGTLTTGEAIGVHETMQPKGMVPNPAHRIEHSELIVVEEGTLEFMHDGKTERADAGSIIYVAFGTLHQVKNVGDGEAKYLVIQIGGDTKK